MNTFGGWTENDRNFLFDKIKNKLHQKGIISLNDEWGNTQFELLSEDIFRETNVLISGQTLKRIVGKVKTSQNYEPYDTTKSTLSKYLGFDNWNHYREQTNQIKNLENSFDSSNNLNGKLYISNKQFIYPALFLFFTSLYVNVYFLLNNRKNEIIKPVYIPFWADKTIHNITPGTSIFKLDLSQVDTGSDVKINFDYKILPTYTIYPKSVTEEFKITYYSPGVYFPKVWLNGKLCSRIPVIVKNYPETININQNDSTRYIPFNQSIVHNHHELKKYISATANIDTNNNFRTSYMFFQNKSNSDKFLFHFDAQIQNIKGINYPKDGLVQIKIIGEREKIILSMTHPKDKNYLFQRLGKIEKFENDTSEWSRKMRHDFAEKKSIYVYGSSKSISLKIGDNKIISFPFNQNLGNVLLVEVLFNGPGLVQDFKSGN